MHVPRSAKGALAVALCVLQVDALVPRSPFGHINDLLPRHLDLLPRQISGTVCDSQCAVFQNAVNDCTSIACLCTTTVANGLQRCVTCAVDAAPTTAVINSAEQLVNTYLDTCVGANVVVPTIPAATTSRTTPITPITPTSGSGSVTNSPITSPSVTAPPSTLPTQTIITTLSKTGTTSIPLATGSGGDFPSGSNDTTTTSGSSGFLGGSAASSLSRSTSVGVCSLVMIFTILALV
ncbi:hypothetical protein BDN70DRAFT_917610 [Pholiota conissans]|uniref:Extracellular membrane protein CFEM domain-containing protein n=1 Tax=Pholiota conissans TaxID=109636 RepID=A0A9P5ZAS8_9AGAR|nr:hypothetical protein BDN70DRAFT_917610 [Pholiota conissans]